MKKAISHVGGGDSKELVPFERKHELKESGGGKHFYLDATAFPKHKNPSFTSLQRNIALDWWWIKITTEYHVENKKEANKRRAANNLISCFTGNVL